MLLFLYGFLAAWALLGLLLFLCDEFQWGILVFPGHVMPWILLGPWLIPLVLFMLFCKAKRALFHAHD